MAGGTAPIAIGRVVLTRVYFREEMFHCPLFGIVPKKQIRANSQNEKNDTGKNNRFYDADTTLVSRTILLQITAHQVPWTSLTRSAYLLRRIRLVVSGSCVDRKSTRLNSSHMSISYAVFCLKKKKKK